MKIKDLTPHRLGVPKKILVFMFLLLNCSALIAQRSHRDRSPFSQGFGIPSSNSATWGDWNPFYRLNQYNIIKFKLEYLHGSIFDQSEKVSSLIKDPVKGVEVAAEFSRYDGKPWYYYYNFPTIGLGFSYLELGNPDMLGTAFNLYPYINLPLLRTRLFSFNIKLGAGAGYVTKKFDSNKPLTYEENNYAIGSNFNLLLNAGANMELLFSTSQQGFWSHFSLTADGSFQHLNNGNIVKPNAGLGMFNVGVGLKYNPYTTVTPMRTKVARMERDWTVEAVLGAGANQQHWSDTKNYLNASFSLGIYRPLFNIYRIGLNGDAFYNAALHEGRTQPARYANAVDGRFRVGISLANELMFGDFAAGVHVGYYALNDVESDGSVYWKLVGKYRVYDRFFVNASVKVHGELVECMELGIGYVLPLPKRDKDPLGGIVGDSSPKAKKTKIKGKRTKRFRLR